MSSSESARRSLSTTAKVVLGLAVAAIVVVVGGIVVFLRDEAPPPLSVADVASTGGSIPADAAGAAGEGVDGTWQVAAGGTSQAGLRIAEQFVGGLAEHEAVGRTTDVTGSVEVTGSRATVGSFTVGLTELTWSDTPGFPTGGRTVAMKTMGLETDRFPTATFELTRPLELAAVPADGQKVAADAVGTLTLHGQARDLTIPVEIVRGPNQIAIATAAPVTVALADHDIPEPSTPSLAGVADTGSFEFAVVLERR